MSDVMLFGVLRMPLELAMSDDLSRFQFYQRAQQALDRIEKLERQNGELMGAMQDIAHTKNLTATDAQFARHLQKVATEAITGARVEVEKVTVGQAAEAVGAWENEAGNVCFGSWQAVAAFTKKMQRNLIADLLSPPTSLDSEPSSSKLVDGQDVGAGYQKGWNAALDHASRVMAVAAEHALEDEPRFWREAASLVLTLQDNRPSPNVSPVLNQGGETNRHAQ